MNDQGIPPDDARAYRVAWLTAGFLRGTLSKEEEVELDDWINASLNNQRLFEQLIDKKNQDQWMKDMQQFNTENALAKMEERLAKKSSKKPPVRMLWVYSAAACVLTAVLLVLLLVVRTKPSKSDLIAHTGSSEIAPGSDRATLVLSNGRRISLDSMESGKQLLQGRTNIVKHDGGELSYAADTAFVSSHVDLYNALTVPAGGQYKLVLPDGTRVWLNASSSLRYPVAFGGAKRVVELTGEGYFEVAKDPRHPFEVKASGVLVQVLGTHFNINAYADEPAVNVVLAEGSVKLNAQTVLVPGEQGSVLGNAGVKIAKLDVETVLGWTKGRFIFKETPIDVLMRQVARWYNAKLVYKGPVSGHFNAVISRDVPVSKLLHLLESTKAVHFKIEDNTIIVMK